VAEEKPGRTLQATALVHEAYLRLIGSDAEVHWDSRGHFFAAAAEAMRRILVEGARGKARAKRGGDWRRVNFEELDPTTAVTPDQLVALDDALGRLAALDPLAGELVKLRYFASLSLDQAATSLGVSTATAYRHWAYARAWLRDELLEGRLAVFSLGREKTPRAASHWLVEAMRQEVPMTAVEDRARTILLAALERAPDQRPAFLDEACGDADVRARVDQLLCAHDALGLRAVRYSAQTVLGLTGSRKLDILL
jgi:RNA polymerase sigma factor (TIGR02999 family)